MGEAANPGPGVHPQIGCINPTGILGKGQLLAQLPVQSDSTIWAISETHLTKPGMAQFKKELSLHKIGMQPQLGAPVPPKSCTVSAIGGKHRGVGFISNTPSRQMTQTWSKEEWNQNRIHAACFLMANRWVQGGVVYGYAHEPDTLASKQLTDHQIQLLINRLVINSQGLRFIAGDFNQVLNGTQAMQTLTDLGWVNVQVWARDKLGKAIQPTCKGVNTKDHIYLSPELAAYLRDVHVEDTWFKDHAVLWATFDSLGSPPIVPLWKVPKPVEWKNIPDISEDSFHLNETNLTQAYADISKAFEQRIVAACTQANIPPPAPSQLGRASTLEVRRIQEYSSPPKVPRQGEPAAEFHGIDCQHAQILRQLRRLVNYQRIADCSDHTSNRAEHKDQLWKSVIRSPGFHPAFLPWVHANYIDLWVTEAPPKQEVANQLITCVEKHLRTFEKTLRSSRIQNAKQRRKDDPNIIFQDLRDAPPQPLQALIDQKESRIVSINQDDNSIVVYPSHQWIENQPLFSSQGPLSSIMVTPDQIWLEDMSQLEVGDTIRQEKVIGSIAELFSRFGDEWKTRWDRHRHKNEDFWQPIVDFSKNVLTPPPPMVYTPITIAQWKKELLRKKKHAAIGPDGYSKQDLMKLPLDLTQQLLRIFELVEAGCHWPTQLVTGFVVALEKVHGATTVGQFRPITVFALAYRVYSSIRSKQLLAHLNAVAPSTCTGNLPNRFAAQVWTGVQRDIEESQHDGKPLSGAVIDLIKAFNLLPRSPILQILTHLRVPDQIIQAWRSMLSTMERRFKLRNQVGPPLRSCTGFAEGDGLSVVAMLAANLMCHAWMRVKHPQLTLWSYVDNIEFVGPDSQSTKEGLTSLTRFSEAMDVLVDQDKTYTWSTQGGDRQSLKQECKVVYNARDLGGHMQYCLRSTNSTVTQKCTMLEPLWGRLARSLATYKLKLQAIKTKAWPCCLHAISSVHMADEVFSKLRTGATKGLGQHSAGMSPAIHLSLVEPPSNDPQFYAVLRTLLEYRQLVVEPNDFVWSQLQNCPKLRPPPGPCSVLLARLRSIGWEWAHNTVFKDHQLRIIDVLGSSPQELKIRLTQGWQDRVQASSSLRKTMKGFTQVSPILTVSHMERWPPDEQAILKRSLNGTFFTADHTARQQAGGDGKCKLCGQADSQLHRHWSCPALAHCRQHLTQQQIDNIVAMPPVIAIHGWMPEPPSLREYQRQLHQLPDTTTDFTWPLHCPDELHIFTDGGCYSPASSMCRLSTWGVVLADIDQDDFKPLACGMVPGLNQTAVRGEILAIISACEFSWQTGRPVHLWVDNSLVYDRLQAFSSQRCWIRPNQKDSDLWNRAQEVVGRLDSQLQGVHKVYSHQDILGAKDVFEEWVFRGNSAADKVAGTAIFSEPAILATRQKLQQELQAVEILKQQVHKTIVACGKAALKVPNASLRLDAPLHHPRLSREDIAEVSLQISLDVEIPLRYRVDRIHDFIRWMATLEDVSQPIRLVTWFELNFEFEQQFQMQGPRYSKHTKRWSWHSNPGKVNFVLRTNHLARFFQGVLAMAGKRVQVLHIRPTLHVFQFWTQCIAFRLRADLCQKWEAWFSAEQPVFRSVRALRTIR